MHMDERGAVLFTELRPRKNSLHRIRPRMKNHLKYSLLRRATGSKAAFYGILSEGLNDRTYIRLISIYI